MMKKTILCIITTLVSLYAISNSVYAVTEWGISGGHMDTGSSGGGGGGSRWSEDDFSLGSETIRDDTTTKIVRDYICDIDRYLNYPSDYQVRIYDINNNDIIQNGFQIEENDLPLAGTAIGFNLLERQSLEWRQKGLTLKVNETTTSYTYTTTYTCKYTRLAQILPPIFGLMLPSIGLREETKTETSEEPCEESLDGGWILKEQTPSRSRTARESTRTYSISYDFSSPEAYQWIKSYAGNNIDNLNRFRTDSTGTLGTETKQKVNECITHGANVLGRMLNWFVNEGASYDVEITDSNDINGSEPVTVSSTSAKSSFLVYDKNGERINGGSNLSNTAYKLKGYKSCSESAGTCEVDASKPGSYFTNSNSIADRLYDARIKYLFFKQSNTCLNLQTAKAYYGRGCNSTIEVQVNPDVLTTLNPYTNYLGETLQHEMELEHWHYFIPLNAKSDSGIKIKMIAIDEGSKAQRVLNKATCKRMMQDYYIAEGSNPMQGNTYIKFIKPINNTHGAEFVGDYTCKRCASSPTWSTRSSDLNKINSDNGCLLTTTTVVPVKQKFYNEVNSGGITTFNGFNFYYKPVDVDGITIYNQADAIFPNGLSYAWDRQLTTVTLWDDWLEEQNSRKSPNLTKSFDQVTYVAQDINARTVAQYNQSNPYTSWSNINANGISNYIGSSSVISPQSGARDNIYKLGCGPANQKEYLDLSGTIKNPLYLRRCAS